MKALETADLRVLCDGEALIEVKAAGVGIPLSAPDDPVPVEREICARGYSRLRPA